ncbi:enoyl-CoA hydratase/isomerase family protein [Verticiella sediminum]|uniref:Enoyl-CoA hydratase/isomerase family protein n=1 Tax=Verticiella sediminum TaxID=1247510 RepID=A0A556AGM8_9BURK|nr:enoyl-CoA hydratase/isomerase family protein [Verticiella sediminum]TSH92035.1 enoyl-CoA hydratase/isomerase family protein [Verticiella sediminum]
MSEYQTIKYETRGLSARITLNRPEVRNAINDQLEAEVKHALRRADADDEVRVIVLTGAAPSFCSGIDLKRHKGRTSREARAHFESFYWGFHTTHRSLSKPTLAVVNGAAREAGCTMAYMCDMIIAAESASFGLPAVDRGIVPAYHIVHLPRLVGRLRAFEICFSGDPISAAEAAQLNIVNRCVPDAELEAQTEAMIERFAHKPKEMLKVGKELFYRLMDMEFEKGIRTAADIVALLASYPESREGFSAYVEKREADWGTVQ